MNRKKKGLASKEIYMFSGLSQKNGAGSIESQMTAFHLTLIKHKFTLEFKMFLIY